MQYEDVDRPAFAIKSGHRVGTAGASVIRNSAARRSWRSTISIPIGRLRQNRLGTAAAPGCRGQSRQIRLVESLRPEASVVRCHHLRDQIIDFICESISAETVRYPGQSGAIRRMVRSEGLEPPRCYPLPPQGSASTSSATSARRCRPEVVRVAGSAAADLTNPSGGYKPAKALNSTSLAGKIPIPARIGPIGSPASAAASA